MLKRVQLNCCTQVTNMAHRALQVKLCSALIQNTKKAVIKGWRKANPLRFKIDFKKAFSLTILKMSGIQMNLDLHNREWSNVKYFKNVSLSNDMPFNLYKPTLETVEIYFHHFKTWCD